MNCQFIVFSIIVSVLIIIPAAYAQVFEEQSRQKSIEVLINSSGEVHVKHVVDGLSFPNQINLIEGKIANLTVKDQEGNEKQHSVMGDNDGLIIFPSKERVIVEYDLLDELILKDNLWTLDFLYLESTSFLFPDVDLIFVNERPVYLGEKKGIMCHGCQMLLEYSLNEPKLYENVKIQDNEYLIEIRTWAKINQFNFDHGLGEISFKLIGEDTFVTIIIPAYNEQKDIAETIKSVQELNYPNFEVLVIDDGSTDDTYKIAKGIAAKDKRVKVFTKKNGGKASAINFMLKKFLESLQISLQLN